MSMMLQTLSIGTSPKTGGRQMRLARLSEWNRVRLLEGHRRHPKTPSNSTLPADEASCQLPCPCILRATIFIALCLPVAQSLCLLLGLIAASVRA